MFYCYCFMACSRERAVEFKEEFAINYKRPPIGVAIQAVERAATADEDKWLALSFPLLSALRLLPRKKAGSAPKVLIQCHHDIIKIHESACLRRDNICKITHTHRVSLFAAVRCTKMQIRGSTNLNRSLCASGERKRDQVWLERQLVVRRSHVLRQSLEIWLHGCGLLICTRKFSETAACPIVSGQFESLSRSALL